MNRKAQGEIITTVLIILLVIAAVVIVWQAVKGSISTTVAGIDPKLKCMDISFTINEARVSGTPANSVKVTRDSGGAGATIKDIKVLVEGAAATHVATGAVGEVETKTITLLTPTLVVNNVVEVSAVLDGGSAGDIVCPKTSASKKAAA